MTGPRELLDAYAEETDFERGDLLDNREHEAPKVFEALRAVLKLVADSRSFADGNDALGLISDWQIEKAITEALEAT